MSQALTSFSFSHDTKILTPTVADSHPSDVLRQYTQGTAVLVS